MLVLPKTLRIGSINQKVPAIIKSPRKKERKNPVEVYFVASLTSFCPSILDIMLPAPCPHIKATACKIAIYPNTTPVAPL